jgi:hypothetical protein
MGYYSNHDLDAYQRQVGDFNYQHGLWQDSVDAANAAYDQATEEYEQAHDEWEASGGMAPDGEEPIPEPQPPPLPTFPEEPQPPNEPAFTYEGHQVEEPELIVTETGEALVLPGRYILSRDGGATAFSLTPGELAAGYTDTAEVDLSAVGQS